MFKIKLPPLAPEYLEALNEGMRQNREREKQLARNPSGRRFEQRRQREEAIAFEDRRVAQFDRRCLKRRKRDQE